MSDRTFWWVFKIGGGIPTYRHMSLESAQVEATRLVDTLGGECVVLEAISIVKPAPRSMVVPLSRDGIPF